MADATLRFTTEGGSEARRMIADLQGGAVSVQGAITTATKKGVADRKRAESEAIEDTLRDFRSYLRDRKRDQEAAAAKEVKDAKAKATEQAKAEEDKTTAAKKETKEREKLQDEEVADAQRAFRNMLKARQRSARDAQGLAEANTRVQLRELAKQGDAQKKFLEAFADAERQATRIVQTETGNRGTLTDREKARASDLALAIVATREQAERRATAVTERESRRRLAILRSAASTAAGFLSNAASAALGAISGERAQHAAHETAIDDALIQTVPGGATSGEIAGNRDYIMQQLRARHIDRDVGIAAIGEAQSFANALGGDSVRHRRDAIDATLDDVEYASSINPNNVTGTVKFGAMLRGRGVGHDMRDQILRNSTGISFAGSVEQENVMQSALPGMLQALNTATAHTTDHAERDRITRDVLTDFQAQLQVVAQSGGAVGVTANRVGTLRTALGNNHRADRLRTAMLGRRHLTAEQRQEVDQSFTHDADGWHIAQGLQDSPSAFAALMGHQFNNDPTAIRNFLGTHGGGGAQMLLARPVQDLIASYMGMTADSHGNQVRQYDYVEDLRRQSLTPEQLQTIQDVRAHEDRRGLVDNANEHEDTLSHNTDAIVHLSRSLDAFNAAHPVLAAALPENARIALAAGGSPRKALLDHAAAQHADDVAHGRGFFRSMGHSLANGFNPGSPAARLMGFLGLSDTPPRPAAPAQGLTPNQMRAGVQGGAVPVSLQRADHVAIGQQVVEAQRNNPPTAVVAPVDAVHAATVANATPPR